MSALLLKNIRSLATMDAERRELSDAWILVRDNVIDSLGVGEPPEADQTLDLSRHVALPGLINTHHHMFQCTTRVMGQQGDLFGWLKACYPVWGRLRSEHVYTAARLAMAELLLSGCTTASDHHYVFPNDVQLEDEIRAAQEMGIRFHAARGSMSVGEGHGGLPPDHLVENEDDILRDTQRLIETGTTPNVMPCCASSPRPARPSASRSTSCANPPNWRERTASACTRTWPRRMTMWLTAWRVSDCVRAITPKMSAGWATMSGMLIASN